MISAIGTMNTGAAAQAVKLTIYDPATAQRSARTRHRQSTPATNCSQNHPDVAMLHYIVKADAFTGFMQHLVNNQRRGVTTDMTTVCAI